MQNVVIQVCQVGPLWGKVGDYLESLFEAEMCSVRFYSNAVQDKDVEAAKSIHRSGRDRFKICCVGKVVEAICDHWQFPVYNLDRRDQEVFADIE